MTPTDGRSRALFAQATSGAVALWHRQMRGQVLAWQSVGTIAALVALAPLVTWGGATVLERQIRAQTAPQALAQVRVDRTRDAAGSMQQLFRDTVRHPGVGPTLEHAARVLPDDTQILSLGRNAAAGLEVELSTHDPDLLRAALRRDPSWAKLHEIGQRRTADARVVVQLRARR